LHDAYRRVAVRDPEWFDKYVASVLPDGPAAAGGGDDGAPRGLAARRSQPPAEASPGSPRLRGLLDELAALDEARAAFLEAASAAAAESLPRAEEPSAKVPAVLEAAASAPSETAAADAAPPGGARGGPSTAASSTVAGRDDDGDGTAASPLPSRTLAGEPRDSGGAVERAAPSPGLGMETPPEPVPDEALAPAEAAVEAPAPPAALSANPDSIGAAPAPIDAPAPTPAPAEGDGSRDVAYFDAARRSWSTVPLDALLELGYRESEVLLLRPEALELIAEESVARPRSGVPARWRLSGADAASREREQGASLVVVLPRDEVGDFLKRQQRREASNSASAIGELPKKRTDGSKQTGAEDSTRTDPRSRVDRAASADDARREPRKAGRSRGDRLADGRGRPIYSGRPARAARSDLPDPPKPASFWPDMDAFRGMLRSEAALRLRILGDDWSGVVKDESDWRLGLYKNWLWMLHNGIGEPLVESRSDRMRRMSPRSLDASAARRSPGRARSRPRARERRNT
jgi:hypothetical protein